jgi:hypothetical protein
MDRPSSNVLRYQVVDIPTSGAEQSNYISCSILPRSMELPVPILLRHSGPEEPKFFATVPILLRHSGPEEPKFIARKLQCKSDEPAKYLHFSS